METDSNSPMLGVVVEILEPAQSISKSFNSSSTGVPAPSTGDPANGRIPYGGELIFESFGSASNESVGCG